MPEGPEVNVIKDGLNHVIKNNLVVSVDLPEGSKFLKKAPDGYNDFKTDLPLKCLEVKSKGKLIYFVFEKGWYLACRLLMSGGWFLEKAAKHNHFEMTYKKNEKDKETSSIWFVDPRHFGTLKFTQDKSVLESILNDIGPDLLNNNISDEDYLKTICKATKIDDKMTLVNLLRLLEKQDLKKQIAEIEKSNSSTDLVLPTDDNEKPLSEDEISAAVEFAVGEAIEAAINSPDV
jgi:formamidopyrimidine-DNA glycosylase